MIRDDGEPLNLAGMLGPRFLARTVTVPALSSRPYRDDEWHDCLVIVRSGEIELETISGAHRRFGAGDILYFSGLGLHELRNQGAVPAVLGVIARIGTTGSTS